MGDFLPPPPHLSFQESHFRSNSDNDIALDIFVDVSTGSQMTDIQKFNLNEDYNQNDPRAVSNTDLTRSNILMSNSEDLLVSNKINPSIHLNYIESLQKLLKPDIKIEEKTDNKYQISVTTRAANENPIMSEEEECKKNRILKIIEGNLRLEFQESFENLNSGSLLLFDYLQISTNENEWDTLTCYLFQKMIIMVQQCELVGTLYLDEICSMYKSKNEIALNLTKEMIPELFIREEDSIVLKKWSFHLNHFIKNKETYPEHNIHLFQLTTNAWNLVDPQDLPSDIQNMSIQNEIGYETPESLSAKILPPTESLPLNLMISVSLINNTNMTNKKYRKFLINTLQTAKNCLREEDNLGLIFVGINNIGASSNSGTFIGFINLSWNGWEEIFERIEVFSNSLNISVVTELSIAINKCSLLSMFLPKGRNMINKLLFISSNQHVEARLPPTNIAKELDTLLNNSSISFTIIANPLPKVQNCIHRIITSAEKATSKQGFLIFAATLAQIGSWEEMSMTVSDLIKSYQTTITPSVRIYIMGNLQNATLIDNDRGTENRLGNESKFEIVMNGLEPNKAKAFDFLELSEKIIDQVGSKILTLKFQVTWVDETGNYNLTIIE